MGARNDGFMTRRFLEKASTAVAWISVGLGLVCMVFGAVVFWAGGGRDLGGIVGGVFFFAGLFLALQALPHTRQRRG
jgi:hypothetical protein